MSSESEAHEKHYAMPTLTGTPTYTRRRHVAAAPRPLDPDDLPLEAERTPEEHELAASLAVSPPSSIPAPDVTHAPVATPVVQPAATPAAAAHDDARGPRAMRLSFGFRRG